MYPYLEKYDNPRNEYKIYFTGKFEEPVEEKPPPVKPSEPVKPPVKPTEPVKEEPVKVASSEDKFRIMVNDFSRVREKQLQLGEVVAMLYKDRIYLVTSDEKGKLLII